MSRGSVSGLGLEGRGDNRACVTISTLHLGSVYPTLVRVLGPRSREREIRHGTVPPLVALKSLIHGEAGIFSSNGSSATSQLGNSRTRLSLGLLVVH